MEINTSSTNAVTGKKYLITQWFHIFGVGSKETRCRIVVDLVNSTLVTAQEWTGNTFVDIYGDRLKDLAESVIHVNQVGKCLEDLPCDAEIGEIPPEWAHGNDIALQDFCVVGAHENGNFFNLMAAAETPLKAFGQAALMLEEAGEEGDAQFFVALAANSPFELPGDSVVSLETVLDPENSSVYGIQARSSERLSVKLTIDIFYKLKGVIPEQMIEILKCSLDEYIDECLFTAESDAELDRHSITISMNNPMSAASGGNVGLKIENIQDVDSAIVQNGLPECLSVRVSCEILYALNGENGTEMVAKLRRMCESSIEEGMLTGKSVAEVESSSIDVEITPEEFCNVLTNGNLGVPADLDPAFKAQIRDLQEVTRVLNAAVLTTAA